MKTMLSAVVIALLFFSGCLGADGVLKTAPSLETGGSDSVENPFSQPAPTSDVPPEDDPNAPPNPDKSIAVSVNAKGLEGSYECGEIISGEITASGGMENFTWDAVDRPEWLNADASGARQETLHLSGTVPYETCDDFKVAFTISVCSGTGICKDTTISFKTKIPKVNIKTAFSDLSATLNESIVLHPEVTGGSGDYAWEVVMNDVPVANGDLNEGSITIPTSAVAVSTIRVIIRDRMLDDRRDELKKKYGDDNDNLAQDEGVFILTVREAGGFLLGGRVINANGQTIATAAANPSLVVPYDGKLQVWIANGTPKDAPISYTLSLSNALDSVQLVGDGVSEDGHRAEAVSGWTMTTIAVDPQYRDEGRALENFKITAQNAVGDTQELVIPSITFLGEPCRRLSAAKIEILERTENGDYTNVNINQPIDLSSIPAGGISYTFRVKDAEYSALVWSFFYVSTPMDSTIDVLDQGHVNFRGTLLGRYFPDTGSESEKPDNQKYHYEQMVLRSLWDADRWTKNGDCSGMECMLHNSFLYDVYAYSDYNAGETLTTSEKKGDDLNTPAQFLENLVIGVKSERCTTAFYHIIPLTIQIPSPSSETFGPSSTASLKYHASAYTAGDDDTSFELEMKGSDTEDALACFDGKLQNTDSGEDKTYDNDKFEYNELCNDKPIIESINQLHIYVDDVGGDWCGAGGTGVDIKVKKITINGKYWTITYTPAGASVCASNSGSDSGDFAIGNPTATLRRDDDD